MSIQSNFLIIKKHEQIAKDTYLMELIGQEFSNCSYGQFINILIDGFFLRRPISICDISKEKLTIVYKIFGDGTKKLSQYVEGSKLNCLYPLGNGFTLPKADISNITIIGGGIGIPPLLGWYKYLDTLNKYNLRVVLGFNNKEDSFFVENFNNVSVSYASDNKNVIDILKEDNDETEFIYSCGPTSMLNALALKYEDGQLLLEERMGCGFGACMGCSKRVGLDNYKRVCVEGPMFTNEEVRYDLNN